MSDKLVICKNCINAMKKVPYSSPFQFRGFFSNFKVPQDFICPKCKNTLYETEIPLSDFKIIYDISHDTSFLEAMIDLKEKDIIEYELKMSQFRAQAEQQKSAQAKAEEDNRPKCPKCGSTHITTGARGVSGFWGFIGTGKTVNRCSNCGNTWKPRG